MASRAERFKKAAVKAAKTARKWAATAAREADRLLAEAQKRAATEQRQRQIKEALRRTGKVLKAVGRAAIVAGVLGGGVGGRGRETAWGGSKKRGGQCGAPPLGTGGPLIESTHVHNPTHRKT